MTLAFNTKLSKPELNVNGFLSYLAHLESSESPLNMQNFHKAIAVLLSYPYSQSIHFGGLTEKLLREFPSKTGPAPILALGGTSLPVQKKTHHKPHLNSSLVVLASGFCISH